MAEIELYDDAPAVFNYEDAGEDADALREADRFIMGAIGAAWYAIAGKVKEMHDRLAKHGRGGTFGRWAATHNWSRDTTARMIRRYDFVLEHPEARQQLLSLPMGVIDVAARPSTPPEVVDDIVAGKVTSVKQAKAMRGDAPKEAAPSVDPSVLYGIIRDVRKHVFDDPHLQGMMRDQREAEEKNKHENVKAWTPERWKEWATHRKEAARKFADGLKDENPEYIRNDLRDLLDPMKGIQEQYTLATGKPEKYRRGLCYMEYVVNLWACAFHRHDAETLKEMQDGMEINLAALPEDLRQPFAEAIEADRDALAAIPEDVKAVLLDALEDGTFDELPAGMEV